jgi:hypothetical protein
MTSRERLIKSIRLGDEIVELEGGKTGVRIKRGNSTIILELY